MKILVNFTGLATTDRNNIINIFVKDNLRKECIITNNKVEIEIILPDSDNIDEILKSARYLIRLYSYSICRIKVNYKNENLFFNNSFLLYE